MSVGNLSPHSAESEGPLPKTYHPTHCMRYDVEYYLPFSMRDKSFHPGQMLFGVYVIKVQLGVGYLAEGGRLADIKVSNPKPL